MKKKGRIVCINGVDVTVTGMDYDYPNHKVNFAENKFNIIFNVCIESQLFVINFSNERLSSQNQYLAKEFIGNGDSYNQFLIELESSSQLRDKKQYSKDTENTANEVIGAIAQSVYLHVQSHSPDQDEE